MSAKITVCSNPNPMKGEISFEERNRQLQPLIAQEKRKGRESVYKEFAQLNMEGSLNEKVMNKLFDFPAAGKIFFFIANHMDGYNALIASYAVFQEALGLSNSTVTRGIKYLKDNGFIYIKKSGATNVYLLNPEIMWKSWGNNMKYCEFPANVILTASEQEVEKTEMREHFKKVIELRD